MKKTAFVLSLLITLLSFSSCQKEFLREAGDPVDTTSVVVSSDLVKTYTEEATVSGTRFTETFNLSYDSEGRILSFTSASSPGDKLVYKYNGTNYNMDIYSSGIIEVHSTFYINSIGFVDSTIQFSVFGDTSTQKYIYDARKLLVRVNEYDYSSSTSTLTGTINLTYDANRNLIKETAGNVETVYEYYSDLTSKPNLGMKYHPLSRNLVKKTTVKDGATQTVDHTYTFDNLNRQTSEKITTANGDVGIKSYTY